MTNVCIDAIVISPTVISPQLMYNSKRGGTLVARAYIKDSTYLQVKYAVGILEQISICSNRGSEKSVGNNDISIFCARKYEMVRMT